MEKEIHDLVIIGAGPAGITSAIYASCYNLKHVLIGEKFGGQLDYAPDILNYPGFPNVSGKELTQRMRDQLEKMNCPYIEGSVISVEEEVKLSDEGEKEKKIFKIKTKDGKIFWAGSVVLATGTERKKLNVPGEIEYTGKGVHYCATCEKQDYRGKVCAVIGGANSAVQAAVELGQAAEKVLVIYRGSELRGDAIWIDQINKNNHIEVIYNTQVKEIIGDGKKVAGVRTFRAGQGEQGEIPCDKVFIEIGGVPGTALVIPLGVEMDKGGYIKVNTRLATNVPGIFAAGDLVSYGLSIEQISSAIGLGARAAASAFMYVKKEKSPTVWGKSQIKR